MAQLYCAKCGKGAWETETFFDDGSFSLVTRGVINTDWEPRCERTECDKKLYGKETVLEEFALNPLHLQCSQAPDYFDISRARCRLFGCKQPADVVFIFPPSDRVLGADRALYLRGGKDEAWEYVDRIFRDVASTVGKDREWESRDYPLDLLSELINDEDEHASTGGYWLIIPARCGQ